MIVTWAINWLATKARFVLSLKQVQSMSTLQKIPSIPHIAVSRKKNMITTELNWILSLSQKERF